MSVLVPACAFLLGILLPHWLLRWDEKRLPKAQWLRSWNDASHWSAVLEFSFLCLPLHFWRTRRSFLGLLLGLFWMCLTAAVLTLLLMGIEALSSALT